MDNDELRFCLMALRVSREFHGHCQIEALCLIAEEEEGERDALLQDSAIVLHGRGWLQRDISIQKPDNPLGLHIINDASSSQNYINIHKSASTFRPCEVNQSPTV